MSDHPDNQKVSLEDLLRLKRAERPESAFWDRFEQELRTKQLAAIVEKRPWWHFDFARLTGSVGKMKFPLGATAVLTLTLVGVREYRMHPSVEGVVSAIGPVPSSTPVSSLQDDADENQDFLANATTPVVQLDIATASGVEQASVAVVSSASSSGSSSGGSIVALDSVSLSRMLPWIGEALDTSTPALVLGVARSFEPTTVNLRDASLDLPAVGVSQSALRMNGAGAHLTSTEEPLAKLTSPTDPQRARLATYVASAFRPEGVRVPSSDRVRERAISRLSDDELYNSVSRIGVAGAAGGGFRLNF